MTVTTLIRRNPLPANLPTILRRLADKVEAGIISEFACVFVEDDEYFTHIASSPKEGLVLSDLLHDKAMQDMRV